MCRRSQIGARRTQKPTFSRASALILNCDPEGYFLKLKIKPRVDQAKAKVRPMLLILFWRATVYTFRTFLAGAAGHTQISNRETPLQISELRVTIDRLS